MVITSKSPLETTNCYNIHTVILLNKESCNSLFKLLINNLDFGEYQWL